MSNPYRFYIQRRPEHDVLIYEVNKFDKNSNFTTCSQNQHATHLQLVDKMCKYDMDLANIVEDTGRTQFRLQTERRTDRQMDGKSETSIPPSTSLAEGI